MTTDEHRPTGRNRLAGASSPYLLQHSGNPVHWREWGPEAVAEARRRQVPLFVSIGYSTCYWCHVMERESFESPATAAVMNERFVCVKVDREQRPDIDDACMAATQILTGRGGWPMSVFLEPEGLRPFFAGTYYPPAPRHGLPSFEQVLVGMSEAYRERREDVRRQAQAVAEAVHEHIGAAGRPVHIGAEDVQQAVGTLLKIADLRHGGFGPAPKFPQPTYLRFLLEVRPSADAATREAIDAVVRTTLDAMMLGGIHDQVGGGFHRYSVDGTWTVPHFEKMLYDNALLLGVYAQAGAEYRDAGYVRTAERTAGYLLREMQDTAGGFYSAQDAEVDGREGLNYLWLPDELTRACGEPTLARALLMAAEAPNFQDPHHPGEPPRYVLRLGRRLEASAREMGLSPDALTARLDTLCEALLKAREARRPPHLDDKFVTAWNGMAAASFAEAAVWLGRQEWLDAAARAVESAWRSLRGGRLPRSWRRGVVSGDGYLEDDAWMLTACAAVARACRVLGRDDSLWSERARVLATASRARFGADDGGLYDTEADESDRPGNEGDSGRLFVRGRSTYDGATPSGVSSMANALLDTAELTDDPVFSQAAMGVLVAHSRALSDSPVATVNLTRALFRVLSSRISLEGELARRGAAEREVQDEPQGSVLEVLAADQRVRVTGREPATVDLVLRIAQGHHLIAADPGEAGRDLVPLRVSVAGGSGVRVYAAYPPGEPYGPAGQDGPVLVYTGELDLRLVLEREPEVPLTGRPMLVLSFQACTDTACAAPSAVELDVAIDAE